MSARSTGSTVGLDTRLGGVVGPAARVLERELGLRTVGDLLGHLPRRYAERGRLSELGGLREGEVVTVQAEVRSVDVVDLHRPGTKGVLKTSVVITDGHSTLDLLFWNQRFRRAQLPPGTVALFSGTVTSFRGKRQLAHPEVKVLVGVDGDDPLAALEWVGAIIPVYPATQKLTSWKISGCMGTALAVLELGDRDDPLPVALRERRGLPGLADALTLVHRPPSLDAVSLGRRRLAYDEAMVVQTALAQRRSATRRVPVRPRPPRAGGLLEALDAALPFTLTDGQRAVGEQLAADLARGHPMQRLLQGEVGSGKTVVALRAMLQVLDAGGQAALMAPTEVLATQHLRSLQAMLGPLALGSVLDSPGPATRVVALTGSQGAVARKAALDAAATGEAGIVVGTHALLELSVQWHDLGLVVVDEQHRFGVEQRDALRANGAATGHAPHVLVMTATPIPRTVAMTVFGDLEVSALTELPRGRQPVITSVVPPEAPTWYAAMWRRVRSEVEAGHRAFVVCPRISAVEPSPAPAEEQEEQEEPMEVPLPLDGDLAAPSAASWTPSPGAALEDVLPLLRDGELRGLRVGELHGRLSGEAKDAAMTAFARGELDVLVATTVVEVGVDVPEATVMVVLDADCFGMSQLHQLRGRVGRGAAASVCLLQTSAPLGTTRRWRIEAVAGTSDGAELARVDLRLRKEGDVLGVAQAGRRRTLSLDLVRDEDLILAAREDATAIVELDPALEVHPALARALRVALSDADADFLQKG